MAEENTRPPRGQKSTADGAAKSAAGSSRKKAPPKAKAAGKPKAAKPAATKTKAKTTRGRKAIAPEPTRDAIAEHAYLLWESGAPGDETAHWLRAEADLRAA